MRVCPIQRNECATDFHTVTATRSADVPRITLLGWRLQSNGLLVAVALGHPTANMVQCILVTDMLVSKLVSKHLYRTEPMPAVSIDTEYQMPVSVSPH